MDRKIKVLSIDRFNKVHTCVTHCATTRQTEIYYSKAIFRSLTHYKTILRIH